MTFICVWGTIIKLFPRSWRNWQTRKTKDLVVNPMQVRFLSTAPKRTVPTRYRSFCVYVGVEANLWFARGG